MDTILKSSVATSELDSWQPDGVTIHSGDPRGRGFTLHEDNVDGTRACGIFECEASETSYLLENNEIIYVLEGSVTITLDTGSSVALTVGDFAFLPKGHESTWVFHSTFKEFWVLTD